MKTHDAPASRPWPGVFGRLPAALALVLLAGCSSLLPPPPPVEMIYVLDAGSASAPSPSATAPGHGRVIEVAMPRARAGFDSTQMVWVRREHAIEVFARNRWADTPARMLAPLLAQALERSGAFRAVVPAPSPLAASLRIETEIVRLQQNFSAQPSRVELTVGARLIDTGTRQVVASAEFDETESAATDDAYGGVRAANVAIERLLARLTAFCIAHVPPR